MRRKVFIASLILLLAAIPLLTSRGLLAAEPTPAFTVLPPVPSAPSAQSQSPQTPTAQSPGAPQRSIAPRAEKLLNEMCQTVGAANAFSFHAEVMFEEVLPANVKVQFAGAMDFAVQRPSEIAVDYRSDLGAKRFWYSGDIATIFDPIHMVYASVPVPPTIDGMMDRAAEHHLTFPLADLAQSDPCRPLRGFNYGGYVGVNDVNGADTDHIAFSSPNMDLQLWLSRAGKPVPLKVLINYRSEPGSPEYIAFLSHWRFPDRIAASHFKPLLPKSAKRIEFLKIKESQP
jgi:hypothetical protein